MEAREAFLKAGGQSFHYIPCLNDQQEWIAALSQIAIRHLQGWDTQTALQDAALSAQHEQQQRLARAAGATR